MARFLVLRYGTVVTRLGYLAGVIAIVIALWPSDAFARKSYITDQGAATAAVAKLMDRVGRKAAVLEIDIAPDAVTLLVQGEARAYHIDQWQLKRHRPLASDRMSFELVSGPQPVTPGGIVTETETGFFNLNEVALDRFESVLAAAVERAGLEEPGQVARVRIARRVSILPKRTYGQVRWTIAISSGRESATIHTNAAGQITYANLDNTERARRLDLFGEDWPDRIAVRDLAAVFGDSQMVYEVRFYRKYIYIEADHPTDTKLRRKYSWNLSGVKASFPDLTHNLAMGLMTNAPQPFLIVEADLTKLKDIKLAALKALGLKAVKLRWLTAKKIQIGARAAELHWDWRFETPDGEESTVLTAPDGKILKVLLPPSLRPQLSYLDPAALPGLFARIGQEFDVDTKFTALRIWPERVNVNFRDPHNARKVKSASMTPERVTASGLSMPAIALPGNADFSAPELGVLTAKVLKRMVDQSLAARIGGKGEISRFTVERGNVFVRSPNGKLTVTVWLEMPSGTGRMTFASDGRIIDSVAP